MADLHRAKRFASEHHGAGFAIHPTLRALAQVRTSYRLHRANCIGMEAL